jgi:hypothetical protein
MTLPTPNYDVTDFSIDMLFGGEWNAINDPLVSASIYRSVIVEGFATSPDVSTCTVVTSHDFGMNFTGLYGFPLRVKKGSSTLFTGVIKEESRDQTPNAKEGKIADTTTLVAVDQMSDLLKLIVTVTIPAMGDATTHGELVESVCTAAGIDIVTVDADLIVGGPKAVKWRSTLLEFLRKMAVSCHARFFTTNLNALRFEVGPPLNTLFLGAAGSEGYADYNSIKIGRDVDGFASSTIVGSITGASRGARNTEATEFNEVSADTFTAGPQLTTWLAQCHLERTPPTLPTTVVSRDIDNLHSGLVDPSEDALIIPPDGGDPLYVGISGVHHEISATDWTVTFDLVNPALLYARYGEVTYDTDIEEFTVDKADNVDPTDAPGGKGGAGSVDDEDTEGSGGGGSPQVVFTSTLEEDLVLEPQDVGGPIGLYEVPFFASADLPAGRKYLVEATILCSYDFGIPPQIHTADTGIVFSWSGTLTSKSRLYYEQTGIVGARIRDLYRAALTDDAGCAVYTNSLDDDSGATTVRFQYTASNETGFPANQVLQVYVMTNSIYQVAQVIHKGSFIRVSDFGPIPPS